MKESGFDAIRAAHNPFGPAFLDACDELGMLVVEEASALAMVNISDTAITIAREVSFTSVITSLVTEGSILLITCGRIMRKNVCVLE